MRNSVGRFVVLAVLIGSPASYAERARTPQEHLERGNALYARGDLRGAIRAYGKAIETNSNFKTPSRKPASAWSLSVDGSAALGIEERIAIVDPLNAIAYYNRATARHGLGDFEGAAADCDKAIRIQPRYMSAYLRRGIARKSAGDLAGAEADFDRALELDSVSVLALNDRGIVRQMRGDLAGALRDFEGAVALDPTLPESYNNRGAARCAAGNLTGAVADFDRALALRPSLANAYSNRGLTRLLQSQTTLAREDFLRAIELDPRLEAQVQQLLRQIGQRAERR